jgi:hypothetical protein
LDALISCNDYNHGFQFFVFTKWMKRIWSSLKNSQKLLKKTWIFMAIQPNVIQPRVNCCVVPSYMKRTNLPKCFHYSVFQHMNYDILWFDIQMHNSICFLCFSNWLLWVVKDNPYYANVFTRLKKSCSPMSQEQELTQFEM